MRRMHDLWTLRRLSELAPGEPKSERERERQKERLERERNPRG